VLVDLGRRNKDEIRERDRDKDDVPPADILAHRLNEIVRFVRANLKGPLVPSLGYAWKLSPSSSSRNCPGKVDRATAGGGPASNPSCFGRGRSGPFETVRAITNQVPLMNP